MTDLHTEAIVLDCHHDIVMTLVREGLLKERATFRGRWLQELRVGGVDVQVMPVSSESSIPETSLRQGLQQIAAIYREVEANPNDLAICRDGSEIDQALASGRIALVLSLEGASLLGNEPSLVSIFYELGIRMISFTHMGRSWLGDGGGEDSAAGGRLTHAGLGVLSAMERLGILMDVSHLGAVSTAHVLQVATRPIIASHSCARALRDHHRNLADDQLRAVAATGGVIGVNSMPCFLDDSQRAGLERMVDHIDYMVEVAGEDHVGLGPDFIHEIWEDIYPDKVDIVIEGLQGRNRIEDFYSSRHLPRLTDTMLRRGFSETLVRKVLGLNFMRVFHQVMGIGLDREPARDPVAGWKL